MKRIVFLQSGQYVGSDGYTLCYDTNHNGLNELIFFTGTMTPSDPLRWEIWEYRPMNRYELVYADTGAFPYPPGITTGNFRPNDVGDIDQDGFTDLMGPNFDQPQNPDTLYDVVTTQENPNYSSYPETLSWWYRYSNNFQGNGSVPFYFPPDLDSDNRNEIMFVTSPPLGCVIFENIGNNQNVVVWNITQGIIAWSFAFGDLDLDGHKEFISADGSTLGRVYIYENTGDDQYEPTVIDTVLLPNGSDVFSGNDLDGDGKPEFFITFARIVGGSTWDFFLYMWEATGNNLYEHTFVASQRLNVGGPEGRRSCCADIDGDGIEELIWATPTNITVFKATGNNQYQQIWQWLQDHGSFECLVANSYDMNKNGYKEIVVGGSGKTSIFELEAVRVLRPNGGEIFQADTQELIRWQTFHPPRCDSLSLFYSLDNGRSYDTIITGIPGADTSYLWTVPDISSDSCKVKIIAYGPGWQYDESDGVFSITPTGIGEEPKTNLLFTDLKISPNPFKSYTTIRFSTPTAQKISLKLYDITGKLIKVLCDGHKEPGIYKIYLSDKNLSSGIYFITLQTESPKQIIKRFVVVK